MEESPNIFRFATSELSQDAFICWLVSWLSYHKDKLLFNCARDFISLLYSLNKKSDLNRDLIQELIDIKQQHLKIDVYFQVKINGKIVSFVIEDKVDTSFHSNQLERYKEAVENDEIKVRSVIGVPVGFVGAAESKKALHETEIPHLITCGPKGGTPIAVAAINSLINLDKP